MSWTRLIFWCCPRRRNEEIRESLIYEDESGVNPEIPVSQEAPNQRKEAENTSGTAPDNVTQNLDCRKKEGKTFEKNYHQPKISMGTSNAEYLRKAYCRNRLKLS